MLEKKRNPNYESSAVMLTNPPQVEGLLRDIQNTGMALQQLRNEADALIPNSLKDKIAHSEKMLSGMNNDIRAAIDQFGSFQDVDKGWYALKQRRESILYQPKLVREILESKLASLVIIESVDTKALDGLIKGGLVTPATARQCGIVEEKFAYIIR